MEFRVLGPVQVLDARGDRVRLASDAQRRLVSLLVLHANQIVRSEYLEEELGLSAGALRTSVSRLRRILGFDTLVTAAPGYELRSGAIDAIRFERCLARSRGEGPAAASATLESALSLWQGDAYAEFAHEAWAAGEAQRLEELRTGAVEDLAAIELARGERPSAIARLDQLIERHPYRERPRELLLRALAGSGRTADALRAYQAYRSLLVDEVGTEPSPRLVALDRQIASTSSADPLAPEPEPPAPPVRGLPSPWSSFIGRDDDRSLAAGLLADHRLVTLTGAGGCGKTRLAIEVARTVGDGEGSPTWWVELAPVSAPGHVAEQVAMAAGVPHVRGIEAIDAMARHAAAVGSVLVVLDNAEHVLAEAAEVASAILERCPRCRVLVTSREPLGVPGERLWWVPPLSLPDAAQCRSVADLLGADASALLLDRVAATRSELVLDEAAVSDIIRICHRLDGLPLALELAAASIRSLPIATVAASLERSLAVLGRAAEPPVDRHQTMQASIAWSVDLLDPQARAALARLAVFVAPFSAEAAVAVVADGGAQARDDAIAALARLVDTNLVQKDETSGRYRLLETTRQFCQQDPALREELERARPRHARHVATWCLEVGRGLHGVDRAPFVREMPEVVAAVTWARVHEPECAFDVCRGLASVRSMLGHHAELEATWTWLLRFDDAARDARWAGAVAALLSAATGAAFEVAGIAAEVAERLDPEDDAAQMWLARGRAMIPAYRGHLEPAQAYAAAVAERGNDLEISMYVGFAAYLSALCGQVPETERALTDLRRMVRRQRDSFRVDTVGNGYAAAVLLAVLRGDLTEARSLSRGAVPTDPAFSMSASSALAHAAFLAGDAAALQRARAWGRRETIAVLRFLVTLDQFYGAVAAGEHVLAADLAEQYWDDADLVPVSRVHPRPILNAALLEVGRAEEAAQAGAQARALVAEMPRAPYLEAVVCHGDAQVALAAGRTRDARAAGQRLLRHATAHGWVLLEVDALELLGVAAHLEGDRAACERMLGAALAERARLGYRQVLVAPRAAYDEARERCADDAGPMALAEVVAGALAP